MYQDNLIQTLHTAHREHTHSLPTGDVNAHSTLWQSYTDDHIGQLIADVISNSDHITLNTGTSTRVPNTTLPQTSLSDITSVYNILYNRTSWITQTALSSGHIPIITSINIQHNYRLQQNRRTFTNYCTRKLTDHHTHQHTPCQHNFHKRHPDGRQTQYTKG